MYHSWQLLVVKSSINTVERAGLLDSLTGRTNETANKTDIINQVKLYLIEVMNMFLNIDLYITFKLYFRSFLAHK